jgi:hypothetical protein
VFFVPAFFVFVLKLLRTKRPEADETETEMAEPQVKQLQSH